MNCVRSQEHSNFKTFTYFYGLYEIARHDTLRRRPRVFQSLVSASSGLRLGDTDYIGLVRLMPRIPEEVSGHEEVPESDDLVDGI